MKVLTMLGFMVMAAFLGITLASTQRQFQPINAVLGDESFMATYGHKPDLNTPESLRIETHLAYVEKKLRQTSVEHLAAHLQQKRAHLLNLLQEYRKAGKFPRNEAYPNERKPCFIDDAGAICAVGYLIEQTEGREVAERINARHQYDYIQDMDMPEVQQWIENSGLTEEECCMIQPQYFSAGPDIHLTKNEISTSYAIGSGGLAVVNTLTLLGQNKEKLSPWWGVLSGAGTMTLGFLKRSPGYTYTGSRYDGRENEDPVFCICYGTYQKVYTRNVSNEVLSWANIGTGAITLAMSSWNLFRKKENPEKYFQKSTRYGGTRYGVSALPHSGLRFTMIKSF